MIIREATENDIADIVAMLADDTLGSQRENFQIPLPNSYTDAFRNIEADLNQELMVVENSQAQVIGTMQLSFMQYLSYQGGLRAQIEAVRIRKDHRGSGLGAQMCQWAIDRAKERGAHVLQLTSDKQRPDALRFYESLGFIASHEGMKLHFKN